MKKIEYIFNMMPYRDKKFNFYREPQIREILDAEKERVRARAEKEKANVERELEEGLGELVRGFGWDRTRRQEDYRITELSLDAMRAIDSWMEKADSLEQVEQIIDDVLTGTGHVAYRLFLKEVATYCHDPEWYRAMREKVYGKSTPWTSDSDERMKVDDEDEETLQDVARRQAREKVKPSAGWLDLPPLRLEDDEERVEDEDGEVIEGKLLDIWDLKSGSRQAEALLLLGDDGMLSSKVILFLYDIVQQYGAERVLSLARGMDIEPRRAAAWEKVMDFLDACADPDNDWYVKALIETAEQEKGPDRPLVTRFERTRRLSGEDFRSEEEDDGFHKAA